METCLFLYIYMQNMYLLFIKRPVTTIVKTRFAMINDSAKHSFSVVYLFLVLFQPEKIAEKTVCIFDHI